MYILGLPGSLPIANTPKYKKISLPKKFLTFAEKELCSSNIKKILIFSQKKPFLIFSQKKAFLIFLEMHFSVQAQKIKKNPPRENFLYFRKRKPRKKLPYISYVFSPKLKKFVISQERTWKTWNFIIFSQENIFIFNYQNFLYQNHQKKFLCCQ